MRFGNIKPITTARYHINHPWRYMESWIEKQHVDMNPDFQRGYVWNQTQKEQYVEWILRSGNSGRDIYFNHPGWMKSFEGQMVLVDGKQRIEAALGFLHGKVKAYGHYYSEYEDKLNDTGIAYFDLYVADLKSRKDVLQWYIDMNTGGTKHTTKEIENVLNLIAKEG